MAQKKVEGTTKKNVINMRSFFSRENEEKGVWFRPAPEGAYIPFQLKVVGPTSSTAWSVNDAYSKDLEAAKDIEDIKERAEKVIEITAKKYAGLCVDIKVDDEVELDFDGHNPTKDDIYDILYNSPLIQDEVYRFYNEAENFLGLKKND